MKTQTENQIKTAGRSVGIKEQILFTLGWLPLCSFELKDHMGYNQIITISRRLTELETEGRVFRTGVILERNGMKYDQFAKTPPGQENFYKQIRNKKLKSDWIKQGKNLGYISNDVYETLMADL